MLIINNVMLISVMYSNVIYDILFSNTIYKVNKMANALLPSIQY